MKINELAFQTSSHTPIQVYSLNALRIMKSQQRLSNQSNINNAFYARVFVRYSLETLFKVKGMQQLTASAILNGN